jgi:hypothetical protein
MGREIRMVVPNWEHPQKETYDYRFGRTKMVYQPMRNRQFSEDMDEWIAEYQLWREGKHPNQLDGSASDCPDFTEWYGNPPQGEYYRPNWKPEEMTWFQVYETVSEGTPVTPPFATKEELVEYLVANGDFWDQSRRKEGCTVMDCEPWARQSAERFVFGSGWAPSMVVIDGKVMSGVNATE